MPKPVFGRIRAIGLPCGMATETKLQKSKTLGKRCDSTECKIKFALTTVLKTPDDIAPKYI